MIVNYAKVCYLGMHDYIGYTYLLGVSYYDIGKDGGTLLTISEVCDDGGYWNVQDGG